MSMTVNSRCPAVTTRKVTVQSCQCAFINTAHSKRGIDLLERALSQYQAGLPQRFSAVVDYLHMRYSGTPSASKRALSTHTVEALPTHSMKGRRDCSHST